MLKKIKIKIDRNLCIGAASCVALEPKVFGLDQEAKAVVLDPEDSSKQYNEFTYEVDEEKFESILTAAKSCPTNAIIVEDAETGQQIYP